jgi:hypothetical protein
LCNGFLYVVFWILPTYVGMDKTVRTCQGCLTTQTAWQLVRFEPVRRLTAIARHWEPPVRENNISKRVWRRTPRVGHANYALYERMTSIFAFAILPPSPPGGGPNPTFRRIELTSLHPISLSNALILSYHLHPGIPNPLFLTFSDKNFVCIYVPSMQYDPPTSSLFASVTCTV